MNNNYTTEISTSQPTNNNSDKKDKYMNNELKNAGISNNYLFDKYQEEEYGDREGPFIVNMRKSGYMPWSREFILYLFYLKEKEKVVVMIFKPNKYQDDELYQDDKFLYDAFIAKSFTYDNAILACRIHKAYFKPGVSKDTSERIDIQDTFGNSYGFRVKNNRRLHIDYMIEFLNGHSKIVDNLSISWSPELCNNLMLRSRRRPLDNPPEESKAQGGKRKSKRKSKRKNKSKRRRKSLKKRTRRKH